MRNYVLIILVLFIFSGCVNKQEKAESLVIKYEEENLPHIQGYKSVKFDQLTMVKTKGNPAYYKISHKYRIGRRGTLKNKVYHIDLKIERILK